MRHQFKRLGWRADVAILLSGVLAATPLASGAAMSAAPAPQSGVIAWSTYLRAGPDETSEAITELEHDRRVEVLGCSGRWCKVSRATGEGYVDREALYLPRTLAPHPAANGDCVVVGQAGDRGPIPTRFCSVSPNGK